MKDQQAICDNAEDAITALVEYVRAEAKTAGAKYEQALTDTELQQGLLDDYADINRAVESLGRISAVIVALANWIQFSDEAVWWRNGNAMGQASDRIN